MTTVRRIALWVLVFIFIVTLLPWQKKVPIAEAASWYDNSWQYRVKVTVDDAKVSASLNNFPVYINLANLPSGFFNHVQTDGDDIRVTASDGTTEVPVDLVVINTASSTGELHFKAPSLSASTDTEFYIYYGNASTSGYGATATYGRYNVWSNGYLAVWHLQENPGGSAPQIKNAAANSYHGTSQSMASDDSVAGKLAGNSLEFDDYPEIVDMGDIAATNGVSKITLSTWAKRQGPGYAVVVGEQASNNDMLIEFYIDGTLYFQLSNGAWAFGSYSGSGADDANWHYAVEVFDGTQNGNAGRLKGYLDGQHITMGYTGTVGSVTSSDPLPFIIGMDGFSAFTNGHIDEVRLATEARSVDWIAAEYNNQNNASTFYVVSSEETVPPPGTLTADIVDASGASVASPSAALTAISTAFGCASTTGTLGTSGQRIRVENNTATPAWTLSLAATGGSAALWSSGSAVYDFNDPAGSPAGCSPGSDTDTYAGLLGVNFNGANLAPKSGCTNTGVSMGSDAHFDEGTTDALTLLTASSSASSSCYWDLTGMGLEQQIPAEQPPGNYSLNLTLTVVAN